MSIRKPALAAAAAAHVLLVGASLLRSQDPAASAAAVHAPEAGTALLYDIDYTGDSTITLPDGSPMRAAIDLSGTLEVRGLGPLDADSALVEATFRSLDRGRLTIGAQSTPAELVDQPVRLSVHDDGHVEQLYFTPGTPVLTRQLMQSLLLDTQVLTGEGTAWTAAQQDTSGTLLGQWSRDDGGRTLHRAEAATYTDLTSFPRSLLDGHTAQAALTATLSPDGTLATLSGTTHLVLPGRADIQTTVRQTLRSRRTFEPSEGTDALAGLEAQAPDVAPGAELAAENALRSRVGDMTAARALALLREGSAIANADFAWQVTGLLRLDPALAALLAELHASGGLSPDSENLIVDLLAGASTPETMAALRSILARPAVQAGSGYGRTVQALVLAPRPDAEMVAFLSALGEQQVGTPQGRLTRNAAAIVASRLAEQGDDSHVRHLAAETAADLRDAATPQERAELLLVMGNLGQEEYLRDVLPFATDPDAEVRAATARALRNLDSDEARAELLALTTDEDSYVQTQALRSLDPAQMQDEDFGFLLDQIAAGTVGTGSEEWFIQLAQQDARGEALLQALLDQGVESNTLRGQIQAAL